MAKILDRPTSGSIAGTTYSHNRAGQYIRNRRTPVVPTRTARQSTIRNQFKNSSSQWSSLTPSQMAAWTAFAAMHPVTDSLGQSVVLTGHQMFVACSTSLQNAGQTIIATPPTTATVVSPGVCNIYADASGTVMLTWTLGDHAGWMLGAVSMPKSAGTTFNKTFTQFGVGVGDDSVMDVSEAFAADWGTPIEGTQLYARIQSVNEGGMTTPGTIVRSLVQPASTLPAPVMATSATGHSSTTFGAAPGASLIVFESQDGGLTFQYKTDMGVGTSPVSVATPGAGNLFFTRLQLGNAWGPKSNVVAGS